MQTLIFPGMKPWPLDLFLNQLHTCHLEQPWGIASGNGSPSFISKLQRVSPWGGNVRWTIPHLTIPHNYVTTLRRWGRRGTIPHTTPFLKTTNKMQAGQSPVLSFSYKFLKTKCRPRQRSGINDPEDHRHRRLAIPCRRPEGKTPPKPRLCRSLSADSLTGKTDFANTTIASHFSGDSSMRETRSRGSNATSL